MILTSRHLTDSNSWPLELSAFPHLAAKGAEDVGSTYTEDQVRHIVQYAGERGIDVVIEIDTPGHTGAIGEAYPEHIACLHKSPWQGYAHQAPTGQLRFADNATADFTASIFNEIMGLTKSSYFGTGGDEINTKCMVRPRGCCPGLTFSSRTDQPRRS